LFSIRSSLCSGADWHACKLEYTNSHKNIPLFPLTHKRLFHCFLCICQHLSFPNLTKLLCLNCMLLVYKDVCRVRLQKNAFSTSYSNSANLRKCCLCWRNMRFWLVNS